jgi:hypothetical protein
MRPLGSSPPFTGGSFCSSVPVVGMVSGAASGATAAALPGPCRSGARFAWCAAQFKWGMFAGMLTFVVSHTRQCRRALRFKHVTLAEPRAALENCCDWREQ